MEIKYQSYLDCLQSRKHCEATMDDLPLFTPDKKSHNVKLEDLLKALLRNGLKISPKSANSLRWICNIWAIPFL